MGKGRPETNQNEDGRPTNQSEWEREGQCLRRQYSMDGMRRRDRLTVTVRTSRLTRITDATRRNVAPGLSMVGVLERMARVYSMRIPWAK